MWNSYPPVGSKQTAQCLDCGATYEQTAVQVGFDMGYVPTMYEPTEHQGCPEARGSRKWLHAKAAEFKPIPGFAMPPTDVLEQIIEIRASKAPARDCGGMEDKILPDDVFIHGLTATQDDHTRRVTQAHQNAEVGDVFVVDGCKYKKLDHSNCMRVFNQ
jgi:hypothetical protein